MAQAGIAELEEQELKQKMLTEMFLVKNLDVHAGLAENYDYADEINDLRNRHGVAKGSPRGLLGLPELEDGYATRREDYTVLSYDACDKVFRDNITFSSEILKDAPSQRIIGPNMLQMIGKEHKRARAVAQSLFLRPRTIDWWKPRWIQSASDSLLDPLMEDRKTDLNLSLCAWMPMFVVTRALGVEGQNELAFRYHLYRSTFGTLGHSREEIAESTEIVNDILNEVIAKRRAGGGDDVISGLLKNDLKLADGTLRKLTQEELFAVAKLVIFAGGGTTWRQLGITIDALLTHPEFWEECKSHRVLIEQAIDEGLRWRATAATFRRLCTRDSEVEGVVIPKGARVNIWLAAGNRDPKVYRNADAFDLHRPKNHHLGFGVGPHRCLGMDVARREMIVAIEGLMDRWPNLRYDPSQPRPSFAGIDQRGMTALPVLLD